MNRRFSTALVPHVFIAPALVFLALFSIAPLLSHILTAIRALVLFDEMVISGAQNAAVAVDIWFGDLKNALSNTVFILIISVFLQTVQAVLLAILVFNFPKRNYFFIVCLAFLPPIFGVAIWSHFTHTVFAAFDGVYYNFLEYIGRPQWFVAYFDEQKTAVLSIALLTGFLFFGGQLQNALVALNQIPPQYNQTLDITGMSMWTRIWTVHIPLIKDQILACVFFGLISTSTIFHTIYAIHGAEAGPNHAFDSLHTLIFRTLLQENGFSQNILGSIAITVNVLFSSAMTLLLFMFFPRSFKKMVKMQ